MENMNKGTISLNDSSGDNSSNNAQTNYIHNNSNDEQPRLTPNVKDTPIKGNTAHINKTPSPRSTCPPQTSTTQPNDSYLTVTAPSSSVPPASPTSISDPNHAQISSSSSSTWSSPSSSPLSNVLLASNSKIPTSNVIDSNSSKGKMKADGNDSPSSSSTPSSSNSRNNNNNSNNNNNNSNNNNNNRTQAAFVNKLYKMLEDQSIQQLISWSENGDLFSVANPNAFSKLVLPQYFKHNNWQSFVRQLNMYGFHKVNDMIHSNLTSDSQKWEFRHQNFRRGAVEELQNIKRKSAKSHHQYLSAAMPTSSVSTSSMGRLLLGGGHLHQQPSHHQHHQLLQQSGGGRSSKLDDATLNDASKMDGQPNPIYQHVMRLEDRVTQISQSHETLKNETDELKFLLTKQQTAMQGITDLLYTLTKSDNKISNRETLENLRQYVNSVYDTLNIDPQLGNNAEYESFFSRKRREETIGTVINFQSPAAPAPPNSLTLSNPTNIEDDNTSSQKSSLFLNDSDTYQNNRSTTSNSNSSASNNNASNSNSSSNSGCNNDSNDSSDCTSNSNSDSSGKKDSIPISSILSKDYSPPRKQSDLHQTSATPEKTNVKRLPSIDAVCMGPYASDPLHRPHQHHQHHRHHHHQQQRQHYSSSSPTTSSAISVQPKLEYERPIQSLPPLQPIQSYLDINDASYQGKVPPATVGTSIKMVPSEPNQGARLPSPYLGLGKESALLNPGSDRPPPCDYDDSPEPKRKCTEH